LPLGPLTLAPPVLRLGILPPEQREFFGDADAATAYEGALARLAAMGAELVPFDYAPFAECARLLYEGPWVAERWITAEPLLTTTPDAVHPVTRAITEPGARAVRSGCVSRHLPASGTTGQGRAYSRRARCHRPAHGPNRLHA